MLQAYEFALDKVGLDFNSYQASEMYCIKLTLPVIIKYFQKEKLKVAFNIESLNPIEQENVFVQLEYVILCPFNVLQLNEATGHKCLKPVEQINDLQLIAKKNIPT